MAKKQKPQAEAEVTTENVAPKAQAGDANKYRYIYTRKSVERRIRRRRVAIVLLVFVLVASLIAGATYAVLSFVDYNSFRVSITQGKAHLTLSNDEQFSNPTSQLSTGAAKNMMDTTYNALPGMKFSNMDGSYEGDYNFFGSSFYLRNTSDVDISYAMRILITNVSFDLDACIRVLVIAEPLQLNEDDEWELVSRTYVKTADMSYAEYEREANRFKKYVCYAKERTTPDEETGETREQVAYNRDRDGEVMDPVYDPNYTATQNTIWYCTNFVDPNYGTIADDVFATLQPWQKVRYTFAIWLEGSDPDTTDDKLGGSLTMNISFYTVDGVEGGGNGSLDVDESSNQETPLKEDENE